MKSETLLFLAFGETLIVTWAWEVNQFPDHSTGSRPELIVMVHTYNSLVLGKYYFELTVESACEAKSAMTSSLVANASYVETKNREKR